MPEYARAYLSGLSRPYQAADLLSMARGQLAAERRAWDPRRPYLFCDTNLLVIRIWSEVKYGYCDPEIRRLEGLERYALHLLTYPDLPWEPDPLRESPHALQALFARYEAALQAAGVSYAVVRGQGPERLAAAVAAIEAIR